MKIKRIVVGSLLTRTAHLWPDKLYLQLRFRNSMGHPLNLENPVTFSEKLQWLKLYDQRPEYTVMVDKYAAKQYVANILGDDYIIPTYGVWNKPEDIDWDSLPDQFVLKCTHDSGTVIIVRNKQTIDRKKTTRLLNKYLKKDYYIVDREWPYKNVPKRIIAEKYLEPRPDINDLPDYKFFCFNGEPKFCQVISGRGAKMCIDFFDYEWNHQPFHEPKKYPFADAKPEKPKHFEQMWQAASTLSKGLPFSRIDFYDVSDKVYFGEITFFPTSGTGGFDPEEWDKQFGDWIKLPIDE